MALAAASLAAGFAGCGGGSSGAAPTAQLAFSVQWEQPASASLAADGPSASAFDTPIPPSVSAIRFVMRPADGNDCCIAVVRGSQEFEERRIQLADVPDGAATLEVNGYPGTQAPAAPGVARTCPTRPLGGGSPCGGDDTLPSFGSDEIPVNVLPGQVNVVDVDVHSLPFLLDLDPADGATVETNPPDVTFAVVDANHAVDEDINVRIRNGAFTTFPALVDLDECRDGDAELPDCSEGGELEVRGFRVTARPSTDLPGGLAELRIRADNTAPTPRGMESNTVFQVTTDGTTTTTYEPPTTSTTFETTTTTVFDTTTTTLPDLQAFCVAFTFASAPDVLGLVYEVDYGSLAGGFDGTGEDVSCTALLSPVNNVLTTFNDDDEAGVLTTAISSAFVIQATTPLAQCVFSTVPPFDPGDLAVTVTEATGSDLSSVSATVTVGVVACPD